MSPRPLPTPPTPEIITAHVDLPIPAEYVGALGTAATRDVGTEPDQVVLGGDARLAPPRHFEGVPLTVYGHSYSLSSGTLAASGGASSVESLFPYRVAKRLRLQYPEIRNVPATPAAYTQAIVVDGGTARWDWQPMSDNGGRDRGIVILDCVTNDTLYRTANATDVAAYKETLRTMLRYLNRRNLFPPIEAEFMATTQPWGTLQEVGHSAENAWHLHGNAGKHTSSSNPGSFIINTWPGEAFGARMVVCVARWNTGIPAGQLVIWDGDPQTGGTAQGIIDCGHGYPNAPAQGGGWPTSPHPDEHGEAYPYFQATKVLDTTNWDHPFAPGNPMTVNVVFRPDGSGLDVNLDCIWGLCSRVGNDYPPYVYVVKDGYNPAWDPTVGGARYAAFHAAIDAVCAETEFDEYAFAVTLDGWDHTTMLHSAFGNPAPNTGQHPNDLGQECYATAITDRILETIPTYTEGVNVVY